MNITKASSSGRKISLLTWLALLAYLTAMTAGLPQKYASGDEDPPACDGNARVNPFQGECGRRRQRPIMDDRRVDR